MRPRKIQKSPKTNADNKAKVQKIIRLLERKFTDAKIALGHADPLELLVATILSAQCTDERVNIVTETLFKKYRRAEDYAGADLKELEQDIRSTGFYHNKAKNIRNCCKLLIEKHGGKVPKTMEELLELPGVARKTANIVLQNAFGVVEGIAVDTHVRRVSQRLGLTENKNPDKIERDLMEIVPKDRWVRISDLFIFLGRYVCEARKPKCDACTLNELCPSALSFDHAGSNEGRN